MAITTQFTPQSVLDFSDVSSTALLTLYSRAIESRSEIPILRDENAERIVDEIDRRIDGTVDPLLSMLYIKKIDRNLVVHAALRAWKYDQYAREYLSRRCGRVIANLGCGLDTRFQRIDDGKVTLFDLDLPEVIRFKRQLLQETERYRMIPASVFDSHWMEQVESAGDGPPLFIAEGLFMYLDPAKVRALVLELQARFPGSELVCEMVNKRWITGIWGKMSASKMQRRFTLGKGAQFKFGLDAPDEMKSWHAGIEFLEHWSYFDTNHPKLGWLRLFRNLDLLRGAQYTVQYRLNAAK